MPHAVDQRQCPPLFRRSGHRNADHLPARIRGRPHQLGAADALLLARPPLHRLFRARLHAVGRAAIGRRLHLQAFLHRRDRGARSSQDRAGAFRRPLDGRLFVAADRLERAGARAVDDAGRRRLWLEPRKSRRLPQAVPGQCRAVRDDRLGRGRQGHARGAGPDSLPGEGPARPRRFLRRAGAARCQGLGQHHARLSGRPALDLHA